jgi:two-component system, chemotaxis family, chemotaxis protein CheY
MDIKTLRVLVVDDSPIISRKLIMMMELLGYRVVKTVENGLEAIAAYREHKPDLVTMDITMPEMDGIAATRAIKREFPDANIIMVTSHGQEKMVLESLKAGAKGYVLKPFQQQRLVAVIEKACHSVILESRLRAQVELREAKKPEAPPQANAETAEPSIDASAMEPEQASAGPRTEDPKDKPSPNPVSDS